jgi:hypothetical protein
MAYPIIINALSSGEISPSLFGRTDLQKYRSGCSTMRNTFVSYRGGAYSRAGTKYVGQCRQGAFGTANTVSPPQNIPFQYNVNQGVVLELGDYYMRFVVDGAYVLEDAYSLTAATNANPGVFTAPGNNFSSASDWVYFTGVDGMTRVDGNIYAIGITTTTSTFTIKSTLTGNVIDTTNYGVFTTSGTVARIYTLTTPYAASDLPSLKWVESADVMTLVHPSYPPYDLARITASEWTLTRTTFSASISAPSTITASASNTTASNPTQYQYVATAISNTTGEESVASPIATITNSVNIAAVAGTNTITWAPVTGASSFNIYKAPAAYSSTVPVGSLFGYIGTALGLSFADTNVTADGSTVPPVHNNPFATSSVIGISMSNYGGGITTATASISSSTGTGFVAQAVIIGGQVQWWVIENGGEGYTAGDTFNIYPSYTTSGSTTSATGSLILGPSTGTWPGCVAYFQERRFYANTNNNPDTYYASQPGAFTNFDTSIPVQDSDAITGTPWAQQVNGIQAMVPMPNGLVILTGLGAWQLSGGGTQTAVTPADQTAVPQAYNGCSPTVRPITINYDILYVQEKGAIVRDLAYNFFVNIYTGTDMTVLSNHLFDDYTILRWDWAEEPYKLVWAVRDDGVALSMTYLKEQDVYAWARHDTNGLFQSVAVVSEPPVNAPYFIVQRLIQNDGSPVWAYFQERMDNRLWQEVEDTWCVDAGLSLPMTAPAATLTASSATGVATLQQPTIISGGANYAASTYAVLADPTGTGAAVNLTIAAGVITAAVAVGTLTGYTSPTLTIIDPTGAGAGAVINISALYFANFEASSGVFTADNVGDVIRMGGGVATITTYSSSTFVSAQVTTPITDVIPDDPYFTPIPAASGDWTVTTPVTTVQGLDYLEGMTIAGLADGYTLPTLTVSEGAVTLPNAASAVTLGLPFIAQVQTLYLDTGETPTVQGRRKQFYGETIVRVEKTRDIQIGANQPDSSTEPNNATVPWTSMTDVQQPNQTNSGVTPLFTGDMPTDIVAAWNSNGQVALQQINPLPMQIIALVPSIEVGDTPSKDGG